MESKKIYEESRNELTRMLKSTATDTIVINVNKLDEITKNKMITAIQTVAHERQREIDKVVLGVQ